MASRTGIGFLGGIGLGAGLLYLMDRSESLREGGSRPERLLAARVRAALGRAASLPEAIAIDVAGGCVTLRGAVLESERAELVSRVTRVAGIERVVDNLARRAAPDGAAGRIAVRRTPRAGLERQVWSRPTRMIAGGAGLGLGLAGLSHGGLTGKVMTAGGAALLARAAFNRQVGPDLGLRGGSRMVDLRKAITVQAPVAEVFRVLTDVASFPGLMKHVTDVRISERDAARSHWIVRGPAGVPVSWDAEVTRRIEDQLFSWKTMPGSMIEHAGTMLFEVLGPETTRVHVHMVYHPPAGAIGHAVATMLGADPKARMDEDLARVAAMIEASPPGPEAPMRRLDAQPHAPR